MFSQMSKALPWVALTVLAGSISAQESKSDSAPTAADDDALKPTLDKCVTMPPLDLTVLDDEHVYIQTRGRNHYLLTTGECKDFQQSYIRGEAEPMPRPTRLACFLLPSAGLMVLSCISDLLYLQHIVSLVNHSAVLRCGIYNDGLMHSAQPQATNTGLMAFQPAMNTLYQRYLEFLFCHDLTQYFFDFFTALCSNLFRRCHICQTPDSCTHDIDRIS